MAPHPNHRDNDHLSNAAIAHKHDFRKAKAEAVRRQIVRHVNPAAMRTSPVEIPIGILQSRAKKHAAFEMR